MLNYNSPIKENKNYSDLTIKEIEPVMKLNIRGKKREFFTNVGKTLNMILLGKDLYIDQIQLERTVSNQLA